MKTIRPNAIGRRILGRSDSRKTTRFDGASLRPAPPVVLASKPQRARDLHEADELDEARLAGWVKQARRLPCRGKA